MTADILQFSNRWNPYTRNYSDTILPGLGWNPYAFDKFTMTWENLGLSCEGTIQISLYLGTDDE
jgi:hypothetical protein